MQSETSSQQVTRAHSRTESIGHNLIEVIERVPGREPTDVAIDLSDSTSTDYKTRYWRCVHCGQERNRQSDFDTPCDGAPETPLSDGGYTIEDPRTRRALLEAIDVHFDSPGGEYTAHSESDYVYEVDIENDTCSCPDHRKRGVVCKHLRRVILEIAAGEIPGLDGTFVR